MPENLLFHFEFTDGGWDSDDNDKPNIDKGKDRADDGSDSDDKDKPKIDKGKGRAVETPNDEIISVSSDSET